MYIHPYFGGELARERQREMLAYAEDRRLARQLHTRSGTTQSGQPPTRRLRAALPCSRLAAHRTRNMTAAQNPDGLAYSTI